MSKSNMQLGTIKITAIFEDGHIEPDEYEVSVLDGKEKEHYYLPRAEDVGSLVTAIANGIPLTAFDRYKETKEKRKRVRA